MKALLDMLSVAERELLHKCIAWHVRPHMLVFVEGLATVSASLRFDNLNVLELGATGASTLSPFLVARGANSTATCYSKHDLSGLSEALSLRAEQYGLASTKLHAEQADIFALDQKTKFDLVMMKDVLGGINRQHDQTAFRLAVSNCLSVLNPNGHLLIIDKSPSLNVIHLILRNLGSAGRNAWHYFTFDELKQLIPIGSFEIFFAAHGILSFGNFGGGILQKVADFLDAHCMERLVPTEKRVVFSLPCRKRTKPHGII